MNSIPVTIRFTSDWGVGTGVGYAGGVDSVVEVDENNQPVVRGTVITGVVREQALTVARALDSGQSRRWHEFIGSLFGGPPNLGDADENETVPRAVIFSDARICEEEKGAENNEEDDQAKVTEVVSVSIDEETGAAKPDHFRIIERAPACVLKGRVDFVDSATWDADRAKATQQIDAAKFVLALAGTLVPAIGSEKTNGDGRCEITVGDFPDDAGGVGSASSDKGGTAGPVERRAIAAHSACKEWLQKKLDSLTDAPVPVQVGASGESPCIACAEHADTSKQADWQGHAESKGKPGRQQADGPAHSTSYRSFDLNIELKTPVVSYEVPMSNEVRSLDFLRGTVVLAWVHSRLRKKFPNDERIRNAVVNGELFVSDATACVGGVRGRPAPMVFSYQKADSNKQSDPSKQSDGGKSSDGGSADDASSTGQSAKSAGESGKVKGNPDKSNGQSAASASETAPPTRELWNRLISKEPEDVHVPVRSGYIFDFGEGGRGALRYGTGAPPVIGRQSTAHDPVRGTAKDGQLFLVRALAAGLTLQSEVTITESLFQHRPAVTENLERRPGEGQNATQQDGQRTLGEMLPEILQGQARLGSRKLTGTFGLAECTTTEKPASGSAGADNGRGAAAGNGGSAGAGGNGAAAGGNVVSADGTEADGVTTIWFTSDLLLRSRSLGAAGSSGDIIDALNRSKKALSDAGARIELFSPENAGKEGTASSERNAANGITPPKQDASTSSSKRDDGTASSEHGASDGKGDHRYRAGLRYRRVDSWSAAGGQPRATRLAVQAGSVLKVRLVGNAEQRRKTLAALRELETVGIGELRAQGYGRFVVGDPLLSIGDNDGKKLHVQLLHSNDFLSDTK